MNTSRTHSSHAMAFPKHTDYACAVEVGRLSFFSRLRNWMRRVFNT